MQIYYILLMQSKFLCYKMTKLLLHDKVSVCGEYSLCITFIIVYQPFKHCCHFGWHAVCVMW